MLWIDSGLSIVFLCFTVLTFDVKLAELGAQVSTTVNFFHLKHHRFQQFIWDTCWWNMNLTVHYRIPHKSEIVGMKLIVYLSEILLLVLYSKQSSHDLSCFLYFSTKRYSFQECRGCIYCYKLFWKFITLLHAQCQKKAMQVYKC